jgi:hypothetical protein
LKMTKEKFIDLFLSVWSLSVSKNSFFDLIMTYLGSLMSY